MRHLEEGTLHEFLDGQLAGDALKAARDHLADCPACRASLAAARALAREALGLIEELDATPESQIDAPQGMVAEHSVSVQYSPARPMSPTTAEPAIPADGPTPRRQTRRWRWLAPVGLAAAAVLAVVLRPRAPDSGATAEKQVIAAAPTRTEPAKTTPDSRGAPAAEPRTTGTAAPRRPAAAPAADPSPRPAAPPPSPANAVASAEADTRSALERRSVADQATKLEELVITPKDAQGVAADLAIKLLGGSIRLVEGLAPVRYEQQGRTIRVVYETKWGPLFLDQWREGKTLTHRLLAFPGTPKDSVAAWSERIR